MAWKENLKAKWNAFVRFTVNIVITLVVVAGIAGAIWLFHTNGLMTTYPVMFQVIGGVLAGLVITTTGFLLAAPVYVTFGSFVNKPGGDKPSGFHLFTLIEHGQVKIVVRGEKVVRMIMDTDDRNFARAGTKNSPDHWEIVKGKGAASPLEGIAWYIRPWAWYVFAITGAVWTGLYPFQRVREYKLEKTYINTVETDQSHLPPEERENYTLHVETVYSDHYRLRQFQYPIHVTQAETRDKIPLDFLGVAEGEVRNPHKAAFGTDRWDKGLQNQVKDKLNETTRMLTLDESLTASSPEEALRIANAIKDGIVEDMEIMGIEITGFKTHVIDPMVSKEELRQIRAEALAKQVAKATREDGMARAYVLREINKANAEGGDAALTTIETEAQVRAAKAAGEGGGTVILTQGSRQSQDPVSAAILSELQKLNANFRSK